MCCASGHETSTPITNLAGVPSCTIPTLERMDKNEIPGQSVRQASQRFYAEAGWSALGAAVLLTIGVAIGADAGGGVGAIFIGVGLLLGINARQRRRRGHRFEIGAVAEERVGSRLWALEERGWLVEQDVLKSGGGNIDHVVHSPGVTFVIDTKASKHSKYGSRSIAQAYRHAEWAARHYGDAREIVAVICLQGSNQYVKFVNGVYQVGAAHLVNFLLDRG
jgi:hypothetical protein